MHHHEYSSQDGFDAGTSNSYYRSEREYTDRYSSSHSRDRFNEDDRSFRDGKVKDRSRDRYSSSRHEKDRSKHHHHHHHKRDRSKDIIHEHSRDRSKEKNRRERDRDYDRGRDRDRRDRRSSPKDRDNRDRDRERNRERDIERERDKDRDRIKDRNTEKYSQRYSSNLDYSGIEGCSSSHVPPLPPSNPYYPPAHSAPMPAYSMPVPGHSAPPIPSTHGYGYHHTYSYSSSSQQATPQQWSGNRTWTAPQPQQPPPPPPDGTPNWDDPEPPPPGQSITKLPTDSVTEDPYISILVPRENIPTVTPTKKPKSISCPIEKADVNDLGNVDLDTRIALMFKGKSFGNAPPFLQMESSESENEKAEVDEGEASSDTNRKEKTKKSHKLSPKIKKSLKKEKASLSLEAQHGASDISSSDDDILLKKETYSPILSGHLKKEEDRMSLSSLSSHDGGCGQRIEEEPPPHPPQVNALYLPVNPHSIDTATLASAYIYPPAANAYYYTTSSYHSYPQSAGTTSTQYFPHPAYMQSSYLPGFGSGFEGNAAYADQYYNPYKYQRAGAVDVYKSNTGYELHVNDPYKKPIEEVVERVSDELKQILKRDFNKKMIENTAYKSFETWWDEQLQKNRLKDKKDVESTEKLTLAATKQITTAPTTARIDKAPDINQLINSHRDISDFGSYATLGLRASIPKLPSFRRIRKEPSPKQKDDSFELHLSDQEEMVHGSDSDKDEPTSVSIISTGGKTVKDPKERNLTTSKSKPISSVMQARTKRKGSSSSFFSSSSSGEDEEDDEDDDEDQTSNDESSSTEGELSSVSDLENKQKSSKRRNIQKQRTSRDVYSDSDDDHKNLVLLPKPVKQVDIYSDSEEDRGNKSKQYKEESKPWNDAQKQNKQCDIVSDLEDISKDSTISVDVDPRNEMKKDNDSIAITSDINPKKNEMEENTTLLKVESKFEKSDKDTAKKSYFEYDRIYSDSDEEREYQERRRRNTEYMAQIEREFLEEQERKLKEETEVVQNTYEKTTTIKGAASKLTLSLGTTTSLDMPQTPDISKIPPTPGARLSSNFKLTKKETDIVSNSCSVKKEKVSKSKKEKNSAITPTKSKTESQSKKESTKRKPMTTIPTIAAQFNSIPQNQLESIEKPLCNGYNVLSNNSEQNATRVERKYDPNCAQQTDSQTEEDNDDVKMSPTSSDGGSSQASQASQVALEHCYSLPPQADMSVHLSQNTSTNGEAKKQHYLTHDHGGYATPPMQRNSVSESSTIEQQSTMLSTALLPSSKPGPGRPRKDSVRAKKKGDITERFEKRTFMAKDKIGSLYGGVMPTSISSFVAIEQFKSRDATEEMMVLYEFLTKGIDAEDVQYIRRSYEIHLQEDTYGYVFNYFNCNL